MTVTFSASIEVVKQTATANKSSDATTYAPAVPVTGFKKYRLRSKRYFGHSATIIFRE